MRTRDELEAALRALGWTIVDGPTKGPNGWRATMRRGTTHMPMSGVTEVELLEAMLHHAQRRGGSAR